jgi:hypothetical protein
MQLPDQGLLNLFTGISATSAPVPPVRRSVRNEAVATSACLTNGRRKELRGNNMRLSIARRRPTSTTGRVRGLRAATVTATVAVALGAAAPLAEAAESQDANPTVSQAASAGAVANLQDGFTAADVRDLIKQMKADGGANAADIAQFEAYANSLESGAHGSAFLGQGTIMRKLIVAGIRHGGVWASKILKRLSPKAAKFLGKHSSKVADAIEGVEGWGEHALIIALVRAGVPTDVAKDLATAIMLVAF